MTEDRVPRCSCGHPRNGHRINGYGPCRSEDGCSVFRAMTEDRVPTRTKPRTRDVVVWRLVRDSEFTEQEAEAMVNDIEREASAQPALPLDVELADALDAIKWHEWQSPQIDRTHTVNLARAILARLGSAAHNPGGEE